MSWCKKSKAWKAHIRNNRKREHLGQFQDFSAACEARWSAERKYGFTDRHGTPRPNNPDRKVA